MSLLKKICTLLILPSFVLSAHASSYISYADGSGYINVTPYNQPVQTQSPSTWQDGEFEPTQPADSNYFWFPSRDSLTVQAKSALVVDATSGEVLFSKDPNQTRSMASITKVMTAVVTLDAQLDMHEYITLVPNDFVGPKTASSKLKVGDTFNRAELLLIALMKSENPAAKALSRSYPGGINNFVNTMNQKAQALGMYQSAFYEATGLDARNVTSANDLLKLLKAADQYPLIKTFSATSKHTFDAGNRLLEFANTNAIVREGFWNVGLSKTGYIREAGRCVVMQANVKNRFVYIVLLDSPTSPSRTNDAKKILSWLYQYA